MPQFFCIVTPLPILIRWIIDGTVNPFGSLVIGFNFGAAIYWELILTERRRAEAWKHLATCPNHRMPSATEMEKIARDLVEARFKAQDIDADRN